MLSRPSLTTRPRDTRPRLVAGRPDLPVPGCLASLTQPAPGAPVGAVIDLALLGARAAGKTQLLYLLLRTLRARAPELDGEEEAQQRALVAAALGGPPPPAAAGPTHAIASLPVASLLDEVGPGGRAACYWRAGLARSLLLSAIAGAAVLSALVLWRQQVGALAVLLALGFAAAGAGFGWVAARSRWLDLGEIEIALWDPARWPGSGTIRLHAVPPPGEPVPEHGPPAGPADLHPVFSQLVRERRRRGAPWRRHAFAPILVVNPIDLGRDPELGDVGRLRRLLPVFAALGAEPPRAIIAISRWSAVEAVCRPDSDRRAVVRLATSGMGGEGVAKVSRETLRRLCLDAEDGREGDTSIHYLRYDAGWADMKLDEGVLDDGAVDGGAVGDGAAAATPAVGDDDRDAAGPPARASVAVTWTDPMIGLEGEARRAFFRFLAALLEPPSAMETAHAMPTGQAGAGE
ncbi:MAG TPA: hypothetical protein VKB80_05275 [Kofleriaceae bacterium]|nr:hypothetical protein [Kofleriaceae bacterium]